MSVLGDFRSVMKCAEHAARSAQTEVGPEHVTYAFAQTVGVSDLEARAVLDYGRSRGWGRSGVNRRGGLFGRKRPGCGVSLRRAIQNETAAGRVTIASVLLLLHSQGELRGLDHAVTEVGGNLEKWLRQHAD